MALKEIRFNCQSGGLCLNRFSKLKKKKSYSVSVDHGSFPLTCGLALPLRNHHRIMISKISQLSESLLFTSTFELLVQLALFSYDCVLTYTQIY